MFKNHVKFLSLCGPVAEIHRQSFRLRETEEITLLGYQEAGKGYWASLLIHNIIDTLNKSNVFIRPHHVSVQYSFRFVSIKSFSMSLNFISL